jgi:hypothetical protein
MVNERKAPEIRFDGFYTDQVNKKLLAEGGYVRE